MLEAIIGTFARVLLRWRHGGDAGSHMSTIRIRAVMFKEQDLWCAQCIEHDIAVQATNPTELRRELADTLLSYIQIGIKEQCDPFASVPPAPKKFEDMWNAATSPIEEEKPISPPMQPIESGPSIVPKLRFVSFSSPAYSW